MSQSLACRSAVLEVFALLFSNRWLAQWQKKRRAQKRLTRTGWGRPEPARFYERIFSLRVTLWYLIFQRLNLDQTQAAVVVNLREGGANRLGRPCGLALALKRLQLKILTKNFTVAIIFVKGWPPG